MSLETELKANTAAITALTAAILALGGTLPATTGRTITPAVETPAADEASLLGAEEPAGETEEERLAREAQEAADVEAAEAEAAAAKAKATGAPATSAPKGGPGGNNDSLAKAREAKKAADAAKKAAEAAATGAPEGATTTVTQAQIRELGVAFLKKDTKEGSAKLTKLLGKYGATNLSTVPKDKYQAVFDELTKLTA
jgi:hypothetical protein